jgi:hypothetical protein
MESGTTSSDSASDLTYDKEALPVKLIYSEPGLTPYPCVRYFVGMTTARAAQSRLGGVLLGLVDGKWVDIDNS